MSPTGAARRARRFVSLRRGLAAAVAFAFAGPVATAAATARHDVSRGGYVTEWILLGPFVRDTPAATPGVAPSGRDFLGPLGGESAAVISADVGVAYQTAAGAARRASARLVTKARDESLPPDLRRLINGGVHLLERDFDHAAGYAFTWVDSPVDQEVFAYFGGNGCPRIWVNGSEVLSVWEDNRAYRRWQDRFRLRLRAGANRLLVRLDNQRGYWGFELELYDAAAHAQAIAGAGGGLLLRDLQRTPAGVSLRVERDPSPQAPPIRATVWVEADDGRLLAQTSALLGTVTEFSLPATYAGAVVVRARAEDGANLKPARGTLLPTTGTGDLASLRAQLAAAPTAFLPAPWNTLHEGLLAWAGESLEAPPDPADPRSGALRQHARDLAAALARKENFALSQAGRSLPLRLTLPLPGGAPGPAQLLVTLPEGAARDPSKRWPLLLNLHGSSPPKRVTPGDPNAPYLDVVRPPLIRVSPIATWTLSDRDGWPRDYLNALLAEVLRLLPADPDRVSVQGGSAGGRSTWEWLLSDPHHFASYSVLVGFDGHPFRAGRLLQVPGWVFNGADDRASVPCLPELMVTALRRAGANVRYDNYAGVGHVVSPAIPKAEWLRFYLDARRAAAPPPPDPLDAFASPGLEAVTLPPRRALRLCADEELAHPEDNLLRAGVKLHLAWRAATGEPASAAFALRRGADRLTQVTALLIPDRDPPSHPLLTVEQIPGGRALRTRLACGPTWTDLQDALVPLRRRLLDAGHRLSGVEQAELLKLTPAGDGRRFWELTLMLAE